MAMGGTVLTEARNLRHLEGAQHVGFGLEVCGEHAVVGVLRIDVFEGPEEGELGLGGVDDPVDHERRRGAEHLDEEKPVDKKGLNIRHYIAL